MATQKNYHVSALAARRGLTMHDIVTLDPALPGATASSARGGAVPPRRHHGQPSPSPSSTGRSLASFIVAELVTQWLACGETPFPRALNARLEGEPSPWRLVRIN